jgi:hypothetical protein
MRLGIIVIASPPRSKRRSNPVTEHTVRPIVRKPHIEGGLADHSADEPARFVFKRLAWPLGGMVGNVLASHAAWSAAQHQPHPLQGEP